MKKILFLFLMIVSIADVQAQRSQVRNAYGYLSTGNLDAAKKAIDNASKEEQVANRPRTLLYKSFIYSGIALDTNHKAAVFGELQVALDAIKQITGKNKGSSIGQDDVDDAFNRIFTASYNRGMRAYNENNLRDALRYFEFASQLNKEDTSLYLNQAVLAQKLFEKEKAIQAYEQLLKMNYKTPEIYRNLGKLYEETGKAADAFRVFQEGREEYPENEGLAFDELGFYLKNGNPADAIEMLESVIKFDPTNPTIWFSLGVAQLKAGTIGEAEDAFKKAVELKPDYYDAFYNLGLIYYNSASKLIKKANDQSRFISEEEYSVYRNDYLQELNVAEKFFEKAYALNPKDVNLLMPLREVYVRTGQPNRAERLRAEIYLLD
ncbi:tetratricopeptide repeat protein [Anseongella ginsenosidimutans]|uniref:Tetratricopeptide repeat protein n=1 Tax=Anseongella ginsenosidimutans TaxID=496056 RepID=A0A4R3KU75_9SPHI|nr:tetratricopeptide repeat protein [Anseongella ginsenosidimutans]QEC53238.1 tetratricopeptide repeat protein [Anseongella ginsenosidimutans]TCS87875.1 tetratricopeptide repeat protein [Anseongella ginsenosidimutans]